MPNSSSAKRADAMIAWFRAYAERRCTASIGDGEPTLPGEAAAGDPYLVRDWPV